MSGGTRSYEMARRLAEAGDEVHVVTSWTDKSTSDKVFITNEEGVVVHWIPIYYSNKMRFYYMVLRGRNFCFIIDL